MKKLLIVVAILIAVILFGIWYHNGGGPMAQDFHAVFDLNGTDEKHISVVDEGGVALAAIQGLNENLDEKVLEIQTLKHQNDLLDQRLNELEATVKQFTAQK